MPSRKCCLSALEQANAKRKEKEALEAHINQGAYVRTGQHWKCESEQGSKLFFQQEKWRGEQRYLGVLEVDSGKGDGSTKLIESQPEIDTPWQANPHSDQLRDTT